MPFFEIRLHVPLIKPILRGYKAPTNRLIGLLSFLGFRDTMASKSTSRFLKGALYGKAHYTRLVKRRRTMEKSL